MTIEKKNGTWELRNENGRILASGSRTWVFYEYKRLVSLEIAS
jgi:hypothetical protein